MLHAISPVASDTAAHYRRQEKIESYARRRDTRADEIRESYTWSDIEKAMAGAPEAQRELFWSQFMPFVLTDVGYVYGLSKERIGAAVHEAVSLAIEEQIDREIEREKEMQEAQHDYAAG
jgi:hypothetical protein